MVFCNTCQADVEVDTDNTDGFSCCTVCGRVVEDVAFTSGVTFAKGADGDGEMVGQFVSGDGQGRSLARYSAGRMYSGQSDSHENAVAKGRSEISQLVEHFRVTPISDAVEAAHRFYRLALQRGFTRGRRVNQVAATCLYMVCREERKPFMLIDFSDHLGINLFTLGAVYLQLIKLLRLEDHPSFTKPIDPSLYLHRFADRLKLPRDKNSAVISTALKLVQSMKRDWLQTGRRPSGVCGAALFIASHVHGCGRSKQDIIAIVHIGWHTIDRRVLEFAGTANADLTVHEFSDVAKQIEAERDSLVEQLQCAANERGPELIESATVPAITDHAHNVEAAEAADGGGGKEGAEGKEGTEERGQDGGAAASTSQEFVVPPPRRRGTGAWPGGCCEHVAAGAAHIVKGMCCECLADYVRTTGGVFEGANDPPAYLNNIRRKVKRNALAVESAYDSDEDLDADSDSQPTRRQRARQVHQEMEDAVMEDEMNQALYSSEMQTITTVVTGTGQAPARKLTSALKPSGGATAHSGAGSSGKGPAVAAPGPPSSSPPPPPSGSAAATPASDPSSSQQPPSLVGAAAAAPAPPPTTSSSQPPLAGTAACVDAAPSPAHASAATAALPPLEASAADLGAVACEATISPIGSVAAAAAAGPSPADATAAAATADASGRATPPTAADAGGDGAAASHPDDAQPPPSKRVRFAEPEKEQQAAASPSGRGEAEGGKSGGASEGEKAASGVASTSSRDDAEHNERTAEEDGGREEGDDEGGAPPPPPSSPPCGGQELALVEEVVDYLSDFDDEDLDCYINTKEEAELKDQVWAEMNKDWLEKQAAKAAMVAADDGGAAGSEVATVKAKRAYVRRQKALPEGGTHTAADAAAHMLEQRKLSSKINYNMLADLFGGGDGSGAGPSGLGEGDEGGAYGGGGGDGYGGGVGGDGWHDGEGEVVAAGPMDVAAAFGLPPPSAPGDGGGASGSGRSGAGRGRRGRGGGAEPPTALAAEIQRREEQKAAASAQEASRYSRALEAEAAKRGGGGGGRSGGLGGLGDDFLDALTFSRGSGDGAPRARPQGLTGRLRK